MIDGQTLSCKEAEQAMDIIMTGQATDSQIASLVSILRYRGETIDEMTGFVTSMREHAVILDHDMQVIDTCGTGGDAKSTFNISTAVAITLSAMGVKVAKHGNKGMSSNSGSEEVLDYLGIPTHADTDHALDALANKNMSFLFAQQYHASMKYAAPTRKNIGFKTIFNLLGPLTNPANCQRQIIGVFDTNYAEKMAETLHNLGTERAVIVTGGDGVDECSITTHTDMVVLDQGKITREVLTPEDVGLASGKLSDIQVDSVAESAQLIMAIFQGEANRSATHTLLLNAGVGLYAAGAVDDIRDGIKRVSEALERGDVRQQLDILQNDERVEQHA